MDIMTAAHEWFLEENSQGRTIRRRELKGGLDKVYGASVWNQWKNVPVWFDDFSSGILSPFYPKPYLISHCCCILLMFDEVFSFANDVNMISLILSPPSATCSLISNLSLPAVYTVQQTDRCALYVSGDDGAHDAPPSAVTVVVRSRGLERFEQINYDVKH